MAQDLRDRAGGASGGYYALMYTYNKEPGTRRLAGQDVVA
jgi:hypothetical protein